MTAAAVYIDTKVRVSKTGMEGDLVLVIAVNRSVYLENLDTCFNADNHSVLGNPG